MDLPPGETSVSQERRTCATVLYSDEVSLACARARCIYSSLVATSAADVRLHVTVGYRFGHFSSVQQRSPEAAHSCTPPACQGHCYMCLNLRPSRLVLQGSLPSLMPLDGDLAVVHGNFHLQPCRMFDCSCQSQNHKEILRSAPHAAACQTDGHCTWCPPRTHRYFPRPCIIRWA